MPSEQFIQFLWRYKLLKTQNLTGTQNEPIQILSFGYLNHDAGPDFINSKIKIGDTIWAGNVEIHVKASDWFKHGHHQNPVYDNVILHAVYENDRPIKRQNGEIVTTLELKGLFDERLFENYHALVSSKLRLPCRPFIAGFDVNLLNVWKQRLLVERLFEKSEMIMLSLQKYQNDWTQVFYEFLFRNFGFKVNALPFELLVKSMPLTAVGKHRESLLQLEALLFGQAGLLDENLTDNYAVQLRKEYAFLRQKFRLQPIDKTLWKMSRMRPVNFPHIRLAQLAFLFLRTESLFSKVIEAQNLNDFFDLLDVETGNYWHEHYVFDKKSPPKSKKLGRDAIHNIIINTFIPFIFTYGHVKNIETYKERALGFFEKVPAEVNNISTQWKKNGISVNNASDSQALIQLTNNYCIRRTCLNCMIGKEIISK